MGKTTDIRRIEAIILCLAFCQLALCQLFVLPAFGADNREKVKSVKLVVSVEEKPEVGKAIGTVKVSVSDDKIEILEPARYIDTDDEVWVRGEVPVVRMELAVKENTKYRFTSSTKVTSSGGRSEVKAKKVLDGGDVLRVELRFPKVTGPLEEPEDYYWDGRRARWAEVEDADKYEVRLYRGNSQVTTVTANSTSYYFYPYMNRGGEYTFRVRALNSTDGAKGGWTDKSEEFYLSSGDVYQGASPEQGSGNGNNAGPGTQKQVGWNQDTSGWTYRQANGSLAQNTWLYVDNNWFYLGSGGYMKTGWLYVDNNWFYLNPISDGTRGAMKTGWVLVDNCWYYLNPVSDGTRGAMKTGWVLTDSHWYYLDPVSGGPLGSRKTGYQNIGGKRYYLDDHTGILWTERNVPDGRWADKDGVIQR